MRIFALALVLTLCATGANAASAWTVDTTGATSASVQNASGTMTLTVGCVAGNPALALTGSGVDIDLRGTFALAVDGKSFPLTPGRARTGLLLSNLPAPAAGIDAVLFDALKTGAAAALSGSAFARVQPAELGFPLQGSGAALKTVATACTVGLAVPVPAPPVR